MTGLSIVKRNEFYDTYSKASQYCPPVWQQFSWDFIFLLCNIQSKDMGRHLISKVISNPSGTETKYIWQPRLISWRLVPRVLRPQIISTIKLTKCNIGILVCSRSDFQQPASFWWQGMIANVVIYPMFFLKIWARQMLKIGINKY